MVVPRSSRYKIRSGIAERRSQDEEERRGEQHGRVTGRHKVPFVPIKTSGTEYVRRYKEKRKRAARGNGDEDGTEAGRGERGMERRRSIGRRSSYDRTDRSDGPGFPLNSQYMIPGNRNEPAFTTSRGGTFLGNDRTRASSEETTEALLVLTKLRDAAAVCIHTHMMSVHAYVMRVRTHTRDCRNAFTTLGDLTTLRNSAVFSRHFPAKSIFPDRSSGLDELYPLAAEISVRYKSNDVAIQTEFLGYFISTMSL